MSKTVEDRFWEKVETIPEHTCWEWTAHRTKTGYGAFKVGRKVVKAHRFAYEMENGPIPEGLCACHKCDNPGCVNPNHIFLGTPADNAHDKVAKGRQATVKCGNKGERNGSRTHPERLARGERNGSTKLTPAKVQEIRSSYAAGGVSMANLGIRFGVHTVTIFDIVHGNIWRHVGRQIDPDRTE